LRNDSRTEIASVGRRQTLLVKLFISFNYSPQSASGSFSEPLDDTPTLAELGEEWKERPKNPGTRTQLVGRGVIGGALSEPPIDTPTLAELGLERKRAARDVTFSDVDDKLFELPSEMTANRNARTVHANVDAPVYKASSMQPS
jgi:hypothetical protein